MTPTSDDAFSKLLERHGRELRLHCYRMLGSAHDSEDVLQETFARAWRSKAQIRDPASARAWLYRIATNACLDELGRRRRSRFLPSDAGVPAVDPTGPIAAAEADAFLEPIPEAWFAGVTADPAARYETKESVALAFVAALAHLTPPQRATLLLRDVVGLSAEETARMLELGLEATNSALFRAREAVERKIGGKDSSAFAARRAEVEALLERYLRAWNELDVEHFVRMLHDEVETTMPPSPTWIAGHAANAAFYRPMFAAQRRRSFVSIPAAANGQGAFAFYRATAADEPYRLRAIQLVELRGDRVARIDHFMIPSLARVFGLPDEIPRPPGDGDVDVRSCLEVVRAALLREGG